MQLQLNRLAALLPLPSSMPFTRDRVAGMALMAAELLVLAVLAWQMARLLWLLVTPAATLGTWQPPVAVAAAVDSSVFGSFDPFFRTVVDDDAAVSGLDLTLSGTRVDNVSGRGSAIIAAANGVQTSFMVGETVQPGVVLTAVGFDSVTLERGGVTEKLFIDQSAGVAPVTPQTAGIDQRGAPVAGSRLADQILVTPRLQGSTITGYVLTPKGAGTAFAAAGLEPGDVLVSVDGASVTSLKDAAGLTQQLDAGRLNISVERGGRTVSLRIGGV